MQERVNPFVNNCSFSGVKPIMADLPYPPVQVKERNLMYANMLSVDYCGAVSELSAITQYINNENRLSCNHCPMAKTLLGIGMAEMMHLQKLGELIFLLGGTIDFTAKYRNGRPKMWTPEYLSIPENTAHMLMADIEAEKDAIRQYEAHINGISDECVTAVLKRIITDEEYHIMLLQYLMKEL
ncbi:hypothetical protein IMSAGC009_04072 [Lachnospiraceae bacterium]|nr:hypothetical protein IMSAGC009_04072 [Lachnospiraceae bacterium]